jgi:hypothetical protein
MKSAWDRIFTQDIAQPLTPDEQEQALRELAEAVSDVTSLQVTPEHERIAKLIREKLEAKGSERLGF